MNNDKAQPIDGQPDWLVGGGEMGNRVRAYDWATTPLGPREDWPQSLRTAVSLCLSSTFPMNIIWGAGNTQIYNDGYIQCCGDVHPRALGEDYRVTWASAWPAIGKSFDRAWAGDRMFLENQRMFLKRLDGGLEETFFTFSHSPIRREDGEIGGLFHPVTETTATMLAERRTRALRDLAAKLSAAADAEDVAGRTVAHSSEVQFDLPFLLYYALDAATGHYRLAARQGLAQDDSVAPQALSGDSQAPWPVQEALASGRAVEVTDLPQALRDGPCGPYDEPPRRALVIPVPVPSAEVPPAILVAGASPRLRYDADYRSFFDLMGVTIGNALGTIRAQEDERRKAEALAEIDRAKTRFFSNVSHEFRTPLTLMLGPLEKTMRRGTLSAADRDDLDMVRRNANRLMKLVNTLLSFTRLEAGRAAACFRPADLSQLTAQIASCFRSACESAGLELVIDCPPLSQPVYLDRDKWEEIVLNLLSNAFKFTPQGRIEVTIREVAGMAELTVRDTGTGIAEGELDRIFERFHRVENPQGRTHEGTGIGLSQVRDLAALHGGTVIAESPAGAGTRFTLRLPFGTAHLPKEQLAEEPAGPAGSMALAYVEEAMGWLPEHGSERSAPGPKRPLAEGTRRPRLLVADDNADMRSYLRALLVEDYDLRIVEDGAAALAAARDWRPDLIVLDVMMPRLDGMAALQQIRRDPALKTLQVIVLSARAGQEAEIEGLDAGADDYIVKPFTASEFLARVRAALKVAAIRAEAEAAHRESAARLAAVIEHAPAGIALFDSSGQMLFGNAAYKTHVGAILPSREAGERGLWRGEDGAGQRLSPEDWPGARALRGETVVPGVLFEHSTGTGPRWLSVSAAPVPSRDGESQAVVIVEDVTARRAAEEERELLMREVNHRAKNMLALVQVMARQSAAKGGAGFAEQFDARVASLAASQDVLLRGNWTSVPLVTLIEAQLAPFVDRSEERIVLSGPEVALKPEAAQTLGMVLHELATNAAKYGALSCAAGRVEMFWTLGATEAAEPGFTFTWQERGGPPVRVPDRTGFGTTMTTRIIESTVAGAVDVRYHPDGLVWTLACERDRIVETAHLPEAETGADPRDEAAARG